MLDWLKSQFIKDDPVTKRLILLPHDSYNQSLVQELKRETAQSRRICYVTFNKTTSGLREMLKKDGLDDTRFYFIDSVTPKLFKNAYPDNCTFIDSIDDLSKLADTILTTIKIHKIDALVIDSLSSLLAYKSDKELIEWIQYMTAFLEKMGVKTIMLALDLDKARPLITQAEMIASSVK